MPKTLAFLHTSPVHIATFDRLLAEIDPDIPARHVVDESLLRDARAHGITAELERRVAQALRDAIAASGSSSRSAAARPRRRAAAKRRTAAASRSASS